MLCLSNIKIIFILENIKDISFCRVLYNFTTTYFFQYFLKIIKIILIYNQHV